MSGDDVRIFECPVRWGLGVVLTETTPGMSVSEIARIVEMSVPKRLATLWFLR